MDEKLLKEALNWEPTYGNRDRPQIYWDIIMSLPKEGDNGKSTSKE